MPRIWGTVLKYTLFHPAQNHDLNNFQVIEALPHSAVFKVFIKTSIALTRTTIADHTPNSWEVLRVEVHQLS